jgi:hypothetical protein
MIEAVRKEVHWALSVVHPVALGVVIVGCALTGAVCGAVRAIIVDYSRPLAPKGSPVRPGVTPAKG